jgi:hypothetical protein
VLCDLILPVILWKVKKRNFSRTKRGEKYILESEKETEGAARQKKRGKRLKAGRVGLKRREMKKERMLIVKPEIELSYNVPTLHHLNYRLQGLSLLVRPVLKLQAICLVFLRNNAMTYTFVMRCNIVLLSHWSSSFTRDFFSPLHRSYASSELIQYF